MPQINAVVLVTIVFLPVGQAMAQTSPTSDGSPSRSVNAVKADKAPELDGTLKDVG